MEIYLTVIAALAVYAIIITVMLGRSMSQTAALLRSIFDEALKIRNDDDPQNIKQFQQYIERLLKEKESK